MDPVSLKSSASIKSSDVFFTKMKTNLIQTVEMTVTVIETTAEIVMTVMETIMMATIATTVIKEMLRHIRI